MSDENLQGVFAEDLDLPAGAYRELVVGTNVHASSGPITIKTVRGPFQGSFWDPILPDDPRWVWSWVDWWVAASFYQAGAEPEGLWWW